MDMFKTLMLLAAGFASGLTASLVLIVLGPRMGWLAVSNVRSAHQAPTVTSGGLGLALPILAYLTWLAFQAPVFAALLTALALSAGIGFADDRRDLPPLPRLLGYALAAALAVWSLAGDWPVWAMVAWALVLLWHANLYNFMDGIDGLAASVGLFFCLAAQVLAGGVPGWTGHLLWMTAGALAGFLTFNWPPAKLFMGDVGSVFLGLLLAALALAMIDRGILGWAACAILLAGFWFDASYTLCVRIVTRQPFHQAHDVHLYQKLARRHGLAARQLAACWHIVG